LGNNVVKRIPRKKMNKESKKDPYTVSALTRGVLRPKEGCSFVVGNKSGGRNSGKCSASLLRGCKRKVQ